MSVDSNRAIASRNSNELVNGRPVPTVTERKRQLYLARLLNALSKQ